jgi:putative tricarboxylic transport membrane protein
MVGERLDLTYAIIWSLAIANVMGTLLCFTTSPLIARLTTIRFGLIAPFMVMIVCFGAFNTNRDIADLLLLLTVGVLGLLMRRFGWPRPPFVVGFVLAQPMETYLYQAVQFYGWELLYRPGVLIIGVLILVFVTLGARQRKLAQTEDESPRIGLSPIPQAVFALVPVAVFGMLLWDATRHSFLGAVFPAMIAVAMLPLALSIAGQLALAKQPGTLRHDAEHGVDSEHGGFWTYLLWFAALIAGTAIIGFLLASIVFFIAFLRWPARCTWTTTLVLTAIANAGLIAVADILVLDFPAGVLQSWFDLPWPLR